MHPVFDTRLGKMLGSRYPIIQTAMGWVSTPELVIASSNAGAFGFLAAAVMTPKECETAIERIKAATQNPFGLNFHSFQPGAERIVDLCVEHGVRAVSYGRAPSEKLINKLKSAGIFCIPTIGAAKHAQKAIDLGADALVCQGQEGGGHTGETPTWLLLSQVLDNVDVPVAPAGGFKDGKGLAAALAFGADGIAMGTRFLLTAESPTPMATKVHYLKEKNVANIAISKKLDGLRQRMVMNNELARLERSNGIEMFVRAVANGLKYRRMTGASILTTLKTAWTMARKSDLTFSQTMMAANAPMIIQKAMVEGKPDEGVLPSGQVAGLIDDLPSCVELVSKMIEEAEARLGAMTGASAKAEQKHAS